MKLFLATTAIALSLGAAPAFAQTSAGKASGTTATTDNTNSGSMTQSQDNRASKTSRHRHHRRTVSHNAGSHDSSGYGTQNNSTPGASTSALPSDSANTHHTTGPSSGSGAPHS